MFPHFHFENIDIIYMMKIANKLNFLEKFFFQQYLAEHCRIQQNHNLCNGKTKQNKQKEKKKKGKTK